MNYRKPATLRIYMYETKAMNGNVYFLGRNTETLKILVWKAIELILLP